MSMHCTCFCEPSAPAEVGSETVTPPEPPQQRQRERSRRGQRTRDGGVRSRNPYLMFLRDFRAQRAPMDQRELVRQGAAAWRVLEAAEKLRYYIAARGVPRRPGRSRSRQARRRSETPKRQNRSRSRSQPARRRQSVSSTRNHSVRNAASETSMTSDGCLNQGHVAPPTTPVTPPPRHNQTQTRRRRASTPMSSDSTLDLENVTISSFGDDTPATPSISNLSLLDTTIPSQADLSDYDSDETQTASEQPPASSTPKRANAKSSGNQSKHCGC